MDATHYIQARLRRGAQTFVYVLLVIGLSMLSGWLVMGAVGVFMLLGFSALLVLVPARLPISLLMRVRGARPLHPAEAPRLGHMVRSLALRAGLQRSPALYLQAGADLQAFAVASGDDTAIGVTPRLLAQLDLRELEGVLAHEMSHLKSGDTRVMGFVQAMRRLTHSLATLALILIPLSLVFEDAVPVSPLALAVLLLAPSVSYLAELGLSRTREYDADLAAARLTGNPHGLASALYKLERHQRGMLALLFGLDDLRVPEALRTHPSTRERVRRLLELAPPHKPGNGPRHPPGSGVPVRSSASVPARANKVRWSVMMI